MYNFGACELMIALEIPSIHKFEITLVYSEPGPRTIKSASCKASTASCMGSTLDGSK